MTTDNRIKVLFICVHNSARSQMAEALLNKLAGDVFSAESAGIEPGELNPIVVNSLQEIDIDISDNKTKSVFDLYRQGLTFQYVITVCDAAGAERCPIFPGISQRISWSFEDPSTFTGTREEKLAKTNVVRERIKSEVESFINQYDQERL
jgi:arsenate reductase (thioredoxin)